MISGKGIRFICAWEGFRSCPYQDAVGVWTRGYGETEGITRGSRCVSELEARHDLEVRVNRDYLPFLPRRQRLKQRELDALGSFAYNLGTGAVANADFSTLARRLRSKEGRSYRRRKRIYREEMPRWNRAGGAVLEGLTKRRAAEVAVAIKGDYSGRP